MIEQILNLVEADAWELFTEICKDPANVQNEVLRQILSAADSSRFAREHDFANIENSGNFRKNVPLSNWDDYTGFSQEMQDGAPDILFRDRPSYFIKTSGTSGRPKLIPETVNGLKAKAATDRLRRHFTFPPHPEIMKGKFFPLVNSADLGYTSCGIPYGTASGLTLMNAPEIVLEKCAFPPAILKISDPHSMDWVLMRFALAEDVRLIFGNNIGRIEKLVSLAEKYAKPLCDDIEKGTLSSSLQIKADIREELENHLFPAPERASKLRQIIDSGKDFLPAAYWPKLQRVCCWLSGTVGTSVASTRKLFPPETTYLDYGYGASEGKFNIPHIPGVSSGPLAIHAAFYEFVSEEAGQDDTILLAHELEDGGRYRMIITTFSGLYRYDMHDIIRVDGFYNNTPEIVFVSKAGDVGNLAGEKLSGITVWNAVATVAEKLGFEVKHVCAVTVDLPLHYIFCIEPCKNFSKNQKTQFLELIDLEICKDIGYGNKRKDHLLEKPEIRIMNQGWQEALYQEQTAKGMSRSQVKLPVIYNNIPFENYEKTARV